MKLYLASGNAHKAQEFQSLADASGLPLQVFSARAVGGMPPVVEDTGSFEGNARKKALALRQRLPADGWALADDSGLCVDALDGAPGVESAYYAGAAGDSEANLAKLVATMRDIPAARRAAHFRYVLLLVGPDGEAHTFDGRCNGRLLESPRGGHGFGYDPLFAPDGYAESFSELGESVKNRLSHRGRAWAALVAWARTRMSAGA